MHGGHLLGWQRLLLLHIGWGNKERRRLFVYNGHCLSIDVLVVQLIISALKACCNIEIWTFLASAYFIFHSGDQQDFPRMGSQP